MSHLGKMTRGVLWLCAALLLFLSVFVGVLIWRISDGPVSLHRLTPYVLEQLNAGSGGHRLDVDDMVLIWRGWEDKFDLRLKNLSFSSQDGTSLVNVPDADVSFSSQALLQGILALSEVNLIAPKIRLIRYPDGHLDMGFGGQDDTADTPPAATDTAPSFGEDDLRSGSEMMRQVVAILSGETVAFPAAAYFRSFGIVDADLEVEDQVLGIVWSAPAADIRLFRQALGIDADMAMTANAGDMSANIHATAQYLTHEERIDLTVNVDEFVPAKLVSISPAFTDLEQINVPVQGKFTARLGADGGLIDLRADLDLGIGRVDLPAPLNASYNIDGGSATLKYTLGAIDIEQLRLDIGRSIVTAQGKVVRPFDDWALQMQAQVTDVATNDLKVLWPETLADNARDWVVTNLSEGIVHQASLNLGLHHDASSGDIILDRVDGDMNMSGIDVEYIPGMPKVIGAVGRAEYNDTSFTVYASQGNAAGITVDEAKLVFSELHTEDPLADIELVVHGGVREALELIDYEPLGFATRLGIDPAQVSGEQATRVVLAFPLLNDLDLEDIDVAAAARIENAAIRKVFRDLDLAGGNFELQVNAKGLELEGAAELGGTQNTIRWVESFTDETPLISHYRLEGDFGMAAMARTGLDVAPYLTGIARGNVEIQSLRNGDVTIIGKTDLTDVVMTVEQADYAKPASQPGTLDFDLTVQKDGGGLIRSVELSAPETGLVATGQWRGDDAASDADQLRLNILSGSFRRSSNLSGMIILTGNDRLNVDLTANDFDLSPYLDDDAADQHDAKSAFAGGMQARIAAGQFLHDGDSPLLRDGVITVVKDQAGTEVDINVRQLDARSFLSRDDTASRDVRTANSGGIGEESTRQGEKIGVFVTLQEVLMAQDQTIRGVQGSVRIEGEEWRSIVLRGEIGANNAGLVAEIEPAASGPYRNVRLTSGDAGAFLKAIDLYESMADGALRIEGQVNDREYSQPFTGTVNVTGFRIVNAPLAARVLGAASLFGLVDVLQGNGIAFDVLDGEFTYSNDVLALNKMAANGSAIGVTSNGSIDLAKDEIRLAGSIVPIYALNSVLGNIPILGNLLVGEEGGGVFAPTYTVEGPVDNPDIAVNPLSTFVPGIFRNLITGASPG
ncbi:AsmA-like C-terminal domain-containing protein [Thalassospira sp.]|uniref:YhdP family protein n=1 Tax=Thalassospira sp. TaxID=1912094 RepID=UPI002732D548|nr:AsmA-like C-terminal domain-containing protein [Thalassospira sp.]MDP2700135.1 AsmA-like C-terminal domain-containing protein [Thalassospira sp.]